MKQLRLIKSVFAKDDVFSAFVRAYPGTKLGAGMEFANFQRWPDWKECLPLLAAAIEKQKVYRDAKRRRGEWVSEWPHLKTWINQRRWEQEQGDDSIETPSQRAERIIKEMK